MLPQIIYFLPHKKLIGVLKEIGEVEAPAHVKYNDLSALKQKQENRIAEVNILRISRKLFIIGTSQKMRCRKACRTLG
jgi:hypothetical protein